jgi:hypothetical protein
VWFGLPEAAYYPGFSEAPWYGCRVPSWKKMAGTMPLAIFIAGIVGIILTTEFDG